MARLKKGLCMRIIMRMRRFSVLVGGIGSGEENREPAESLIRRIGLKMKTSKPDQTDLLV